MTSAEAPGLRLGIEGLGLVGLRVARAAVTSPDIDVVVPIGGSAKRREEIYAAFGAPVDVTVEAGDAPLDVVVLSGIDADHLEAARDHLARGRNVVSTADSPATVEGLLDLGNSMADEGRFVVVGAGFCPGMSTLLTRHAADAFDTATGIDVDVAVTGTAGASCAARRAEALRRDGVEWREGAWNEVSARSGPELLWFPDPIGAVECVRAESSEPRLVSAAIEGAAAITSRVGEVPRRRQAAQTFGAWRRTRAIDEPGGVRVEVQGLLDGHAKTLTYGVMDRPSIVAAAVAVASAVRATRRGVVGGLGVAQIGPPVEMLSALRVMGVRASVFEGVG